MTTRANRTWKARFVGISTGLIVAFALTGCASSTASTSASATYTTDFNSELVTPGILTVATTATAPPLTTTDDSGKVVGFWPDLVVELGKRLNLKTDVKQIAWDGLLPESPPTSTTLATAESSRPPNVRPQLCSS